MKRQLIPAIIVMLFTLPLYAQDSQQYDPCMPEDEIVKTHDTNFQNLANTFGKFSTKVEATSDCKEIVAAIDSLVETLLMIEPPMMMVDRCPKSKKYLSKEENKKVYADSMKKFQEENNRFNRNMTEIVKMKDCPQLGKAVKKLKLALQFISTHQEQHRQAIFDMNTDKK